jgi:hypothetical protein
MAQPENLRVDASSPSQAMLLSTPRHATMADDRSTHGKAIDATHHGRQQAAHPAQVQDRPPGRLFVLCGHSDKYALGVTRGRKVRSKV